jgi:dihydropyrimidine dehydrogenase (NAD+) subunit PreA
MVRCLLCQDAECSKACGKIQVDKLLRSIWFDNEEQAAASLPEPLPCLNCSAPCERSCLRPGEVPIKAIMQKLHTEVKPQLEEPPADESRLRTELCGIPLENPFLLSSSVVASTYDMCARAFEAGWPASASKPSAVLKFTRPLPATLPSREAAEK